MTKQFISASLLVLLGCTTINVRSQDFVQVNQMRCFEVGKVFPKKYLKKVSSFDRTLNFCGVTYRNVYISRDVIRAKYEMFHHVPEWKGREIIGFKYNVPYCLIVTRKGEFPVQQRCEDI